VVIGEPGELGGWRSRAFDVGDLEVRRSVMSGGERQVPLRFDVVGTVPPEVVVATIRSRVRGADAWRAPATLECNGVAVVTAFHEDDVLDEVARFLDAARADPSFRWSTAPSSAR
jgi:hypothetical protein